MNRSKGHEVDTTNDDVDSARTVKRPKVAEVGSEPGVVNNDVKAASVETDVAKDDIEGAKTKIISKFSADSDDEEEGEIVETTTYRERAQNVWTLDLCNPPKSRLVNSPLEYSVTAGRPLANGLWLEFGVFSGQTINLMASHCPSDVTVYGFDTFTGLPEAWRNKFEKGMFDRKGNLPKVAPNVTLVKGLFQHTLEGFLRRPEVREKKFVSVCHLDADLYSSTIYVLRTLADRIVPGTLLVFDEFINYPEYREHEWLAFLECVEEYGWEFEWIAQAAVMESKPVLDVWDTQQVAVRITGVKPPL